MSPTNAPDDCAAALCDTYHAATVAELHRTPSLRRWVGAVDQRRLFPHRGRVELTSDVLSLGSWRRLTPDDVLAVAMEYLPEYSRAAAGGVRGGFPSFGLFSKVGAPLVLDLRTGERIVLLVGYTWWSGTTKDADWLPALEAFVSGRGAGSQHNN